MQEDHPPHFNQPAVRTGCKYLCLSRPPFESPTTICVCASHPAFQIIIKIELVLTSAFLKLAVQSGCKREFAGYRACRLFLSQNNKHNSLAGCTQYVQC